jgi:YD repeat-containing protein
MRRMEAVARTRRRPRIARASSFRVGQLKKVTNPDGSFIGYTYDAAHRLTAITNTSGNTLHYTLDLMGNVTKEEMKNSLGVAIATKSRVFDLSRACRRN